MIAFATKKSITISPHPFSTISLACDIYNPHNVSAATSSHVTAENWWENHNSHSHSTNGVGAMYEDIHTGSRTPHSPPLLQHHHHHHQPNSHIASQQTHQQLPEPQQTHSNATQHQPPQTPTDKSLSGINTKNSTTSFYVGIIIFRAFVKVYAIYGENNKNFFFASNSVVSMLLRLFLTTRIKLK